MNHTPIILEVAFEPGKPIVIGNGERVIAIIPNDGGEREQELLDHAHRIAALWNMAVRLGLTMEEIESGNVETKLKAAAQEMLEALEEVVALTENLPVCPFCNCVLDHRPDCLSHEIEAAIRKARGDE